MARQLRLVAALALFLLQVHPLVRRAPGGAQLLAAVGGGGAYRQAQGIVCPPRIAQGQGQLQPLHRLDQRLLVGIGQKRGKFVPPNPGRHVIPPKSPLEHLCRVSQKLVPGRVPQLVVGFLELVHVRHHDAYRELPPLFQALQLLVEVGPVVDAGQHVVRAQVTQLGFRALALRDVQKRPDYPARCIVRVAEHRAVEDHVAPFAVGAGDGSLETARTAAGLDRLLAPGVERGQVGGEQVVNVLVQDLAAFQTDLLLEGLVATEIDAVGVVVEDRGGEGVDQHLDEIELVPELLFRPLVFLAQGGLGDLPLDHADQPGQVLLEQEVVGTGAHRRGRRLLAHLAGEHQEGLVHPLFPDDLQCLHAAEAGDLVV